MQIADHYICRTVCAGHDISKHIVKKKHLLLTKVKHNTTGTQPLLQEKNILNEIKNLRIKINLFSDPVFS